jgi:hypothetical protein
MYLHAPTAHMKVSPGIQCAKHLILVLTSLLLGFIL